MAESEVDYLYEGPTTGRLGIGDDGRAFRQREEPVQGPSLAGSTPRYGIGGTRISTQDGGAQGGLGRPTNQVQARMVQNPTDLASRIEAMEQQFLDSRNDMSTAVDHTLIRDGMQENYDVPSWLRSYMDNPTEAVDKLPSQQYRMEQDTLRQMLFDRK